MPGWQKLVLGSDPPVAPGELPWLQPKVPPPRTLTALLKQQQLSEDGRPVAKGAACWLQPPRVPGLHSVPSHPHGAADAWLTPTSLLRCQLRKHRDPCLLVSTVFMKNKVKKAKATYALLTTKPLGLYPLRSKVGSQVNKHRREARPHAALSDP